MHFNFAFWTEQSILIFGLRDPKIQIPSYPLSPLDGRYASRISKLAKTFSDFGLQKMRVQAEVLWWEAVYSELSGKAVSSNQKKLLEKIWKNFDDASYDRISEIEAKTHHDVKEVEYFLQELWKKHDLPNPEYIHFGLTSEDTNSCAYGLLFSEGKEVFLEKIKELHDQLLQMATQWQDNIFLARTHGQYAIPTTMGRELAVFANRLAKEIKELKDHVFEAKCLGAIGTGAAWKVAAPESNWLEVSKNFVESLGLESNQVTTQIVPAENLVKFFQTVVRVNGIILDLDRDMWTYISQGLLLQKKKEGEIGSSTMPHKVNPIDFENSEGNLGISTALLHHFAEKLPVSRLQRDLSDSTVKRSAGVPLGHSYLAISSTLRGLQKISFNELAASKELNEHAEVLAEALQTILRAAGRADAYELLQRATQGKPQLSSEELAQIIKKLPVEDKIKTKLLAVTSQNYLGYTSEIISLVIKKNVPRAQP